MKFKGLGVAMVTPMNVDGSIDYTGLEKLTNHMINGGVDYLVVIGTTGESPTLSFDEKLQVLNKVIEVNNNRVPVVFGVGGNNTAAVVQQLKAVESLNIDGILSVSPAYNKPTQKGIIAHFDAVCSATSKDVILYNVPGRTSSNMTAETSITIASKHKNAVAIKEASGDMAQIMQLLKDKPDGFDVISGDDPLTMSMMAHGAIGVISVVGNALPEFMNKMVHNCLENDFREANLYHNKVLDFTSAIFAEGNPAGIKEALKIMGICDNNMRLPVVNVSEQTKKLIDSCLKSM